MQINDISIAKIKTGRNSRVSINKEDLSGLMESIKNEGLLEPIGVAKTTRGSYQIAYGNRRFLAFKKLGKKTIPAIVVSTKDQKSVDLMNLAENIQRENISVVEVGRYIDGLTKQGLTQNEIKVRLGVTTSYIKSCLATYQKVPKEFQEKVAVSQGAGISKTKTMSGKIPMSLVPKLTGASKSFNLNKVEAKKLYTLATKNGFQEKLSHDYAREIKAGTKDPIKKVGHTRSVEFSLLMSDREYKRLVKKYVTTKKHKSINFVLRAIVSGKLKEKVAVKTK